MPSKRRPLLKAIAGGSAMGLLAGCTEETDQTTQNPNSTPIETATTFTDDPPRTDGTDTCDDDTVEPSSGSEQFDLWVALTDGEANLLRDANQLFANNYGHSVALSNIPNSNYEAKIQSAIPSGEGPHMFLWAHDFAGSYWESDFLADKRDPVRVDPCQYTDQAWQAAQYDGHLVGLPFAAESVALIYNKSIVDEPPETLPEMTAIMDEHHDPENGSFGLGYPINPYYVSPFAQAFGKRIYNPADDELHLTSDAVKQGLRVVLDDLKPYMPRDPGGGTQKSIFANGNAAFTVDGPWQLAAFEDTDFEVGVTTLPTLPDGGLPRPFTGIKLLFFAKRMREQTPSTQAAREFAEWYTTNVRRVLTLANNGGFVPVNSQVADDDRLPSKVQSYARQIEDGYLMPSTPKMKQVWGPFGDAVTQAFNDNGNLDDLLSTAEENIRNNWAET
jgi:arabinogalactan oligomer/maltooligosaccharide transport system substrate-binding protein